MHRMLGKTLKETFHFLHVEKAKPGNKMNCMTLQGNRHVVCKTPKGNYYLV